MKSYHPMIPLRRLLALMALIGGLVAADQVAEAAPPQNTTARQDTTTALDAGDGNPIPADPVIEEPLRPLLPAGQTLPFDAPRRCGSMPLFLLPVGLLFMQAMRLSFFRRKR